MSDNSEDKKDFSGVLGGLAQLPAGEDVTGGVDLLAGDEVIGGVDLGGGVGGRGDMDERELARRFRTFLASKGLNPVLDMFSVFFFG